MLNPTTSTPSAPGRPRRLADFPTLAAALDYAAQGDAGINFYSGRGKLVEALSYRELRQQALDYARRLAALGLKPGERLAIIAESDGDFTRVFCACQYAGLVPAPLPLPLAFAGREPYVASLRRMIRNADAVAAFAPEVLLPWLREATEGLGLRLVSAVAELRQVEPVHETLPTPQPDGLSYLQFSSGSTRHPLGVAVTQRTVMANAAAVARYGLAVRDGDRGVSWLPLYHDMGLVGFLLIPLACQISVDLLPTREFARRPLVWLDLISRNRGTLAYSPSFGYELCARRADGASPDLDLSCWRAAGIGGDMIRPQVLEEFAERMAARSFRAEAFVASYGMAEATLALSFAPLGRGIRKDIVMRQALEHEGIALPCTANETAAGRTFVSCGRILPGHRLEVRDEAGRVLPERRVGTIFVWGPSITLGYHGHLEETRQVLSAGGWLNTGDLGYLADGEIVVTGRAKDLIIVNGRNIWPQDLEWAAETELPALRSRDVVVFSLDGETAERVIALVQCRATAPEEREALRAEATGLFRRQHGIEVSVVLVPPHSLPQTSSGKLSRTRAKQMLLSGAFEGGPLITSAA
jgi:fatty-acyl-CoA synthase